MAYINNAFLVGESYGLRNQMTKINWQKGSREEFNGFGRGAPNLEGMVMVSISMPKRDPKTHEFDDGTVGFVTKDDWKARLSIQCIHGAWGWACKKCLGGR